MLVAEPATGDRYLLCSDGLSDFVPVTRSIARPWPAAPPSLAADRLVDVRPRRRRPDNVTVIVADVVEDDDPQVPRSPAAWCGRSRDARRPARQPNDDTGEHRRGKRSVHTLARRPARRARTPALARPTDRARRRRARRRGSASGAGRRTSGTSASPTVPWSSLAGSRSTPRSSSSTESSSAPTCMRRPCRSSSSSR